MNAISAHGLAVEYSRWFKPPLRAVDGLDFEVGQGALKGIARFPDDPVFKHSLSGQK